MHDGNKRKKIGLALGSGGWRGLAHIGVIKCLIQNGYEIDFIAGCSVGALVGGMYAATKDINKVENLVNNIKTKNILSLLLDPAAKHGLIKGNRLTEYFLKITDNINIEDMPIKYSAVATDVLAGEPVIINKGSLAIAMRASGSIPFVFKPVLYNNKYIVDGGTSEPVPVSVVRAMGADIVIGVNLYGGIFPMSEKFTNSLKLKNLEIGRLSYQLLLSKLAMHNLEHADIALSPKIPEGKFDIFFKFANHPETIKYGEEAMCNELDKLRIISK